MFLRNVVVLGAACIGLLMLFAFQITTRLMYSETNIDDKLVEMELTTIKDFTVQGEIPLGCYQSFLLNNSATNDEPVDIKAFKEALKNALRDKLHTEA